MLSNRPVKVQFPLRAVSADLIATGSVFPAMPLPYDSTRMRMDNQHLGFYVCPPTSGNLYRRDALLGLPMGRLDQRDFIDGPPTLALPHLGDIVSRCVALAEYRIHGRKHSGWSRPDAEQLLGEITWFERRGQVESMLGIPVPCRPGRLPLYVLERRMMAGGLGGGSVLRSVPGFVRSLWASCLPRLHKVALTVWAVAMVVPSPALRRRAVYGRRSPPDRPAALRFLIRGVTRLRHVIGG